MELHPAGEVTMRRACLFALLGCSFLALPATAADPAKPAKAKLYITNSGGDDVSVIDPTSHRQLARIEVGLHPHGIAVPAAQDVIYVTVEDSKPSELVAIDPHTDKVVKRLPVGNKPNELAVTPDGKFAYIPVQDGNWEVIDLDAWKIIDRIHVGGAPHNTLCSVDGKRMFLAPMGNPKSVTVVDVGTRKVEGTIPFGDVVRPIALTKDGKRLYAEVDNLVGIEVADVETRKVLHRVPSELTDEQKKVPSHSHGLAIRPDQKEVWACDVEHQEVQVFDVTGDLPKQVAALPMGGKVYWMIFADDGKTAYVSVRSTGEFAVVDVAGRKIKARIAAGKEPKRLLLVTPGGKPSNG
jgi:YVTN family beta-propeller protein